MAMPPKIAELLKDKKKLMYLGAGLGVALLIAGYFIFFGGEAPAPEAAKTTTTATKTTQTTKTTEPVQNTDEKAISEAERLLKKLDKDFSSVDEGYVEFLQPNAGIPIKLGENELYVQMPFDYLVRPKEGAGVETEQEVPPAEETFPTEIPEEQPVPAPEEGVESPVLETLPAEEPIFPGEEFLPVQ